MNRLLVENLHSLISEFKKIDSYKKILEEKEDSPFKDFVSSMETVNTVEDCKKLIESFGSEDLIKSLESIVFKYSKKRRKADSVKESFDDLNNNFKETVQKIIEAKQEVDFERYIARPFVHELFDKFCDYKFKVTGNNDEIHEAKSLEDFKSKNIDYSNYEFSISMKEAEKSFCDFVYFNQWWKPQFSEGKQINEFVISTNKNINIYLNRDILVESAESLYFKPSEDLTKRIKEGVEYFQPNEDLNKTTVPSWIKFLASGKICIKESHPLEKIIELNGEVLKGIFKVTRPNENSDFWSIEKI